MPKWNVIYLKGDYKDKINPSKYSHPQNDATMDFSVVFEHPLFQLPRLHIPINPIDNPDDFSGVGVVKYAQ